MESTDSSATDTGAELASELRIATFRLGRRLRGQRATEALSDGRYVVLATLRLFGPHTLGELAERERVTPPSMNRTVNDLEELGYVTRTTDEADRRKVNIALTEAGHQIVEETIRRRDAWLEAALEELSPADRDLLAAAAHLMREMASR